MTILTTGSKEHKPDIKTPEVSDLDFLLEAEKEDVKIPAVVVGGGVPVAVRAVPPQQQIYSRRGRCLWLSLLLIILLVVLTIGAICLYNRLNEDRQNNEETFFCGVRFREDPLPSATDFELTNQHKLFQRLLSDGYRGSRRPSSEDALLARMLAEVGEFEEGVTIGGQRGGEKRMRGGGEYERITVPQIGDTRRSTVIHDFNVNYTAIVDSQQHVCFIMPLNRTFAIPPADFFDMLTRVKEGYYVPDTRVVRERYRVVTPSLVDLTQFGINIAGECYFYTAYRLVRNGEPVAMSKRSACEFSGSSYCLGDAGAQAMLCISLHDCL